MTPRGADVDRYFYPRPPRGGRQLSTSDMAQGRRFLSTPSARRATVNSFNVYIDGVFLSTPSARRATLSSLNTGTGGADFYPRPPRGGRRISGKFRSNATGFLSTPSARRATGAAQCEEVSGCISIHALREEGDCSGLTKQSTSKPFLSTPSARRAT